MNRAMILAPLLLLCTSASGETPEAIKNHLVAGHCTQSYDAALAHVAASHKGDGALASVTDAFLERCPEAAVELLGQADLSGLAPEDAVTWTHRAAALGRDAVAQRLTLRWLASATEADGDTLLELAQACWNDGGAQYAEAAYRRWPEQIETQALVLRSLLGSKKWRDATHFLQSTLARGPFDLDQALLLLHECVRFGAWPDAAALFEELSRRLEGDALVLFAPAAIEAFYRTKWPRLGAAWARHAHGLNEAPLPEVLTALARWDGRLALRLLRTFERKADEPSHGVGIVVALRAGQRREARRRLRLYLEKDGEPSFGLDQVEERDLPTLRLLLAEIVKGRDKALAEAASTALDELRPEPSHMGQPAAWEKAVQIAWLASLGLPAMADRMAKRWLLRSESEWRPHALAMAVRFAEVGEPELASWYLRAGASPIRWRLVMPGDFFQEQTELAETAQQGLRAVRHASPELRAEVDALLGFPAGGL